MYFNKYRIKWLKDHTYIDLNLNSRTIKLPIKMGTFSLKEGSFPTDLLCQWQWKTWWKFVHPFVFLVFQVSHCVVVFIKSCLQKNNHFSKHNKTWIRALIIDFKNNSVCAPHPILYSHHYVHGGRLVLDESQLDPIYYTRRVMKRRGESLSWINLLKSF